jgi:hypothetical protein
VSNCCTGDFSGTFLCAVTSCILNLFGLSLLDVSVVCISLSDALCG